MRIPIIGLDPGSGGVRCACVVGGQPAVIPGGGDKNDGYADFSQPSQPFPAAFRTRREDAEVYLNQFVSACMLAVPCRFSDAEAKALARAAEEAGLREVYTISCPVAVAYSFGAEGRFLVLDFGAGKAEVSVVEGRGGAWRVLDSVCAGDISGRAFDASLAEWLSERLLAGPMPQDSQRRQALLAAAEALKVALSAERSLEWTPPVGFFAPRPLSIEREDFERMARFPIRRLVRAAGRLWERHRPERLLLAGGSCGIPLLRETLAAEVAGPELTTLCGADSAAVGAALYARAEAERFAPSSAAFWQIGQNQQSQQNSQKKRELQARIASLDAKLSRWQSERLRDMVSRLENAENSFDVFNILDDIVKKLEMELS